MMGEGQWSWRGCPLPHRAQRVQLPARRGRHSDKAGQFADAIKWLLWAEALLVAGGRGEGVGSEGALHTRRVLQGGWGDERLLLTAPVSDSTVQYSRAQYSKVQNSTVQYSAVQYCAVLSMPRDFMYPVGITHCSGMQVLCF